VFEACKALGLVALLTLTSVASVGAKDLSPAGITEADFISHDSVVFTKNVTDALAKQTVANLFVRDQGMMIGNGQPGTTR
jgi:hypothetical protein